MAVATVTMQGRVSASSEVLQNPEIYIDEGGLQRPTKLNITSVISLPFLLLLFVIRYSEIRVFSA